MLFTMFCCLGLIVTFVGIFFRGPGYTFVIPYVTSPGPPLRPMTATSKDHAIMSNYQVELDRQAGRADQGGHQVAAQAAGPGPVAPPADARARSGPAIGLWLLEVTAGHARRSPWPNLKGGFGAPITIGDLDDGQAPELARCRSTRASRPTTPRRARS